jgi:NitT/TauT family transport system substrate-binding protein
MSRAMIAGDILVSDSDVPAQLSPKVAGILDVRVIAVTINRLEHFLIVRGNVKTADDLKGKCIAISRFGSSSDFIARYALSKVGLTPGKDITIVQIGSTTARVDAALTGRVQRPWFSLPPASSRRKEA